MTQHLLIHTTRPENVDGVKRDGLEPRLPREHNSGPHTFDYELVRDQPKGIYVVPEGERLWHWADFAVRFAYCGPLQTDPVVSRGRIVPERVPPEALEWLS